MVFWYIEGCIAYNYAYKVLINIGDSISQLAMKPFRCGIRVDLKCIAMVDGSNIH